MPDQSPSNQNRAASSLGSALGSQSALIGGLAGGIGKTVQPINSQQTNTPYTQMGRNEYISEILKMDKEILELERVLVTLNTNE